MNCFVIEAPPVAFAECSKQDLRRNFGLQISMLHVVVGDGRVAFWAALAVAAACDTLGIGRGGMCWEGCYTVLPDSCTEPSAYWQWLLYRIHRFSMLSIRPSLCISISICIQVLYSGRWIRPVWRSVLNATRTQPCASSSFSTTTFTSFPPFAGSPLPIRHSPPSTILSQTSPHSGCIILVTVIDFHPSFSFINHRPKFLMRFISTNFISNSSNTIFQMPIHFLWFSLNIGFLFTKFYLLASIITEFSLFSTNRTGIASAVYAAQPESDIKRMYQGRVEENRVKYISR